jgi:hypothetical protein
MACMTKQNDAAHGLSGWVVMLLNGLVRCLLQPARESVVLASVTDLSRSKADLIADAERALLRQQLAILNRQTKRPHMTVIDRLSLLFFTRIV